MVNIMTVVAVPVRIKTLLSNNSRQPAMSTGTSRLCLLGGYGTMSHLGPLCVIRVVTQVRDSSTVPCWPCGCEELIAPGEPDSRPRLAHLVLTYENVGNML